MSFTITIQPTGGGQTFMMGGGANPAMNFITREAPGLGQNLGGAIEAVVSPNGVIIKWFHMP